MNGLEKIDTELPEILPESEEAWIKLQEAGHGPRMMRALQRVAAGASVREAGEAEGYKSMTDVYRHCKKWGLVDTKTRAIIDKHRDVATLSGEELRRRIADDPDAVTTRDLTVINGVATDKVLAYEKNAKDDGGGYISALESVAKRVADSGVSLELKVTLRPSEEEDMEGEVIDVVQIQEESCSKPS
jgi:hypothetical protein